MAVDPTKALKRKATPPGADPTSAWVSVVDIRNIFSEQLRRLDTELCPGGRTPNYHELFAFFDTLQYRLYQRAGANFDDFLLKNPIKAQEILARQAQRGDVPADLPQPVEAATDSRVEYEARRAKLTAARRGGT